MIEIFSTLPQGTQIVIVVGIVIISITILLIAKPIFEAIIKGICWIFIFCIGFCGL